MRTKSTLVCGVILGASVLAVAHGQQGQPAIGQTTIAVVDMTRVFETAQMPKDLERIFGERKSDIETEARAKKEKIDLIQRELDSGAFAKDSPDYEARILQMETLKLRGDHWLRSKERSLSGARKRYFEVLYKQVTQACQDVAQSQGIDIVLSDNPVDFDIPDAAVLINQILAKKVVYASPRVDLTQIIIDRFDNEYLRLGGADSIKLAK
jgi:Skp family chaperone for outer membrane proteins